MLHINKKGQLIIILTYYKRKVLVTKEIVLDGIGPAIFNKLK